LTTKKIKKEHLVIELATSGITFYTRVGKTEKRLVLKVETQRV
jgi:hypothetical protein